MLGNEMALGETLRGAMNRGAVITPATPLLTPGDLEDRIARGNVRHIVASAGQAGKFTGFPESLTRIAVGDLTGWKRYEDSHELDSTFVPDGETQAADPLLLYFTSRATSKPKLVRHNHQSYPVRSEEHTSELQSLAYLVCRLLLEKKKKK